jgi:hypothetical protein
METRCDIPAFLPNVLPSISKESGKSLRAGISRKNDNRHAHSVVVVAGQGKFLVGTEIVQVVARVVDAERDRHRLPKPGTQQKLFAHTSVSESLCIPGNVSGSRAQACLTHQRPIWPRRHLRPLCRHWQRLSRSHLRLVVRHWWRSVRRGQHLKRRLNPSCR